MSNLKIWIRWFIYVLFTQDERMMYDAGKAKGKNCIGLKKGMTSTTFYYEYGKPERKFVTRKEFFDNHKTIDQ